MVIDRILVGVTRGAAGKAIGENLIEHLIGHPLRAGVRQVNGELLQSGRRESGEALWRKPALMVGPQQLKAVAAARRGWPLAREISPRHATTPGCGAWRSRCIGSDSSSLSSSARSVIRCGSDSPLNHRVINSRSCCTLIKGATGRCHAFNIVNPHCAEWAHLAIAAGRRTHHLRTFWGRITGEDAGPQAAPVARC